jgi:hypothetical protein
VVGARTDVDTCTPSYQRVIISNMSTVVGIGTSALAIATFALAWIARGTMRLTRVSVARSQRPVIVPATSSNEVISRIGRISEAPAGMAMHDDCLVLSIENVGAGPAINIRGGAEAVGGGIITGSGRTFHPVEGLSAGRSNAVIFNPQTGSLEPRLEVAIRLLYEDIAGVTHATDLRYSASAKAFQCTIIEPPVDRFRSPLKTKDANAPIAPWPAAA